MPRIDPDQPLPPSVLDRLLDIDPQSKAGPPKARGQHLAELRQAIRRDLEGLLNTQQRCRSWPPDLAELDSSLISYGIPDFAGARMSSAGQREQFRRAVEDVIRRFEPRFKQVAVTLLDDALGLERTLHLHIEALMHAEPAPEPVVFDSLLDPAMGRFTVTGKAR